MYILTLYYTAALLVPKRPMGSSATANLEPRGRAWPWGSGGGMVDGAL